MLLLLWTHGLGGAAPTWIRGAMLEWRLAMTSFAHGFAVSGSLGSGDACGVP